MSDDKRLISVEKSIIPACDVKTLQQLEKMCDAAQGLDKVRAFKVGFSLGLRYGLPRISEVIKNRNADAIIIYDHQKASTDIPIIENLSYGIK